MKYKMTDTETKQMTLAIIEQAQEGQLLKFHYIRSWDEFQEYTRLNRATKAVIKLLSRSANNLFKEYCKDVIAGISDVTKLAAYSQIREYIDYYIKEAETQQKMLDEYDNYLGDWGNFWHSFLGGERDLWDMH